MRRLIPLIFLFPLAACNSYFANGVTKTYFTSKVSDGVFGYNSACVREENWRNLNAPYATCRMFLNKGLTFSQYQNLRLDEIPEKLIFIWVQANYEPEFFTKAIHSEIETPLELDNWIETLGIPSEAFEQAKLHSQDKKEEKDDPESEPAPVQEALGNLTVLLTLRDAVRKGISADTMQRINLAYPKEWKNTEATFQIAEQMNNGVGLKAAAAEFFTELPKK